MKSPDDTRPESWHRFFAASANNAAWTLAERPADAADQRELLDAAHAAAWHWHHVGNELSRIRALLLLALAHAEAGLSDCNHGRVDFTANGSNVDAFGYAQMALTRLTMPAGLSCN